MNIDGEAIKKFTVQRKKKVLELPVTIFYLNPDAPHLGFLAERDPKTRQFKVSEVLKDSPASQAGLLLGDALLKQNDFLLDSWKQYYRAVLAQKENATQIFQIERGGRTLEKKITPVTAVPPAL